MNVIQVRPSSFGPAVRVGLLTVLLSAAASTVLLASPGLARSLVGLIAVAGGLLALRGYLGVLDPVSPMAYSLLLALYYAIGIWNPMGVAAQRFVLDRHTLFLLALLVLAGLGAFWAGVGMARMLRTFHLDVELPSMAKVHGAAGIATGLLLLGAVFSLPYYLRFGVPILAGEPGLARTLFMRHMSPYVFHQWILIELALVFACVSLLRRQAVLLSATVAGASALLLLGLGSRVLVGTPIVIAVIVSHLAIRRVTLVRAVAIGLVVALIVGGLWLVRVESSLQTREMAFGLSDRGDAASRQMPSLMLGSLTLFARTSVEAFGWFVKNPQPPWMGEIAFMSIIAVLPGSQDDIGLYRVTSMLGGDPGLGGGTTLSLIGGAWVDFKLPGVLVMMALLGAGLSVLYRAASRGRSIFGAGIYAIVLSYYVNMIYGGQWLDTSVLWRLNLWWNVLSVDRLIRNKRLGPLSAVNLLVTALVLAFALYKSLPSRLFGG